MVYVDIGDGTLWLLPTGGSGLGDDVFIQRGVGVVGLVAMGAVPGTATVTVEEGGVDVLVLNDGLEAFDDGTTVEAALLRSSRHRRSGGIRDLGGGDSGVKDASAVSGTVRNMLLARYVKHCKVSFDHCRHSL